MLVILLIFGAATTSPAEEWKVVHGMDNTHDLHPCCHQGLNVSFLKDLCAADRWCAGFSTTFGTLKYSATDLAPQSNTDFWVRISAPPAIPKVPTAMWPRPAQFSAGNRTVLIDPEKFEFHINGESFPLLEATLKRFAVILSNQGGGVGESIAESMLSGCDVQVSTNSTALTAETDESYELSVPDGSSQSRAKLSACTVFGAMRGLETFVALWSISDQIRPYKTPLVPCCSFSAAPLSVKDAPRFPHRGLMVDTGRHFLPVSILIDHLEAMSAARLNVFHWHITDTQSWPLELHSLPLATKAGAWDNFAVYSHEDVQEIVQEAHHRGIRVIPEIDMPGVHFDSMFRGYPGFAAKNVADGGSYQNIDPTKDEVWKALEALFGELAELFTDEVIHVGFDEVTLQKWNTTAILAWMGNQGMKELIDVESYILNRVRAIAATHNKKILIWDDPVAEGVVVPPQDIGVQVWDQSMQYVGQLSEKGYDIIYSAPFYLDNLGNTWDTIYANTDMDHSLPGVRGAEACMWGEQVDETNAISRVWPRAAALAELLWSPGWDDYPRIKQLNDVRLAEWRCRIRRRGVSAEPIYPDRCHGAGSAAAQASLISFMV